ncbi:MAG: L-aspartate oxidase [Chitinophagales bacterium]|jgi:L-aspartate oxidase
MKTDILILGSGIAGLSLAIKLARQMPDRSILVLTKTNEEETNTRYAQGGVAAVWNPEKDNFDKHIADTLDAGDGLCKREIVELVVSEGPKRVQEIIDMGARFDKAHNSPDYDLAKEGGHSEHRILHYKDLTGWEIQRTLLQEAEQYPQITLLEHYFALDLITQHHLGRLVIRVTPGIECYGCYALNKQSGEIETILARATVLCTGGGGQVYKSTTNPIIATGDGVAMVYRAKGRVEGMEFMQFHPTSLYHPSGGNPSFLISEAVRGFGAVLKSKEGETFMEHYDERLSLAPRDIVARAIDSEMKKRGTDCMYLDCTHLDKEGFLSHFPTIHQHCLSLGIDPLNDLIPVVPACHYMCGGIWVDEKGRSSIHRLYAAGECTSTGLHGANRLASNSLLEALVFAHRIAEDLSANLANMPFQEQIPDWNSEGTMAPKELVLITQSAKELKEIMSYYVGIVRNNVRLKRAMDRLFLLYQETETLYSTTAVSPQLMELRNLITVAYLITRSAAHRRESRGLHFNTDFPGKLPFVEYSIL